VDVGAVPTTSHVFWENIIIAEEFKRSIKDSSRQREKSINCLSNKSLTNFHTANSLNKHGLEQLYVKEKYI
jgi:hypothetical protein